MNTSQRQLLTAFATFAVGGPQVRYAAIANRFPDRYAHQIVAMNGAIGAQERLGPDVSVRFPQLEIRKGDTLGNRRRFRAFIRETRPYLLITHNWGSIEWGMANWPPLVRHIHIEDGFGPEEQSTQIPRRVWTRRLVLARSVVVVPSRTLERIATQVWRLPLRRVRYIPNGIDLSHFSPRIKSGNNLPEIGTVAALRPEKNLRRLLHAFALACADTPARLTIVGDGPERPGLEHLAAELGIAPRVRFTGHIADPAQLIENFDIFAVSSDTEQMPISVIEAMAAGLPVAATNVGDIRDMLAEDNAAFVTTLTPDALAAALITLLRNPALRSSIGALNRAKAEREFGREAMCQAYAALFD